MLKEILAHPPILCEPLKDRPILEYLCVIDRVVSLVLV